MEEVMFIEANPKFKSINVYDATMSSVKTNDLVKAEQKQGNGLEDKADDSKKKDLKKGEKVEAEVSLNQSVSKPRKGPKI